MLEKLRLTVFALLLIAGLFFEITSVIGLNKYRFSVNRLHPAGMGDTLGLLLMGLSGVIYTGFDWLSLKIVFMIGLFWLTSPVCTHLIARLVQETDEKRLEAETEKWKP